MFYIYSILSFHLTGTEELLTHIVVICKNNVFKVTTNTAEIASTLCTGILL